MGLIILDRDGVINYDSPEYVTTPEAWTPIPGSLEAIARLNRAGYRVVVATNQSGLARGLLDIEALNRIHRKMGRLVGEAGGRIEAVFFCPHGPDEGCSCRKPEPGLLLEVGERFETPLADVPFVGDTPRDVEAAQRAGCQPIWVDSGLEPAEALPQDLCVPFYPDLAGFVEALLAQEPME